MKKFKNIYDLLSSAILSGICISIGCIVFLKTGGIIGAILFCFGLITVTHYKFDLFTGKCGFIENLFDFRNLLFVLFGNIIGCFIVSLAIRYSQIDLIDKSMEVFNKRLEIGLLPCGFMGIGCGFIMTTAVQFARYNKYLPLLFGVPVFILCGFLHSIADAFYILMLPYDYLFNNTNIILKIYGMIVLGNFIGCNLVRIIKIEKYEYLIDMINERKHGK